MGDVPAKTPSTFAKYRGLWLTLGVVVLFVVLQVLMYFLPSLRGVGVVVTDDGQALAYRSSAWMLVPVLLPGAVLIVVGVVLIRSAERLKKLIGGVLILAAVSCALMFAPTVLGAGVELRPDGFTSTYGMWWHPVSKTVRFDELAGMSLVHRRQRDGRGDESLECFTSGGEVVAMPLGDCLRVALPEIRERAGRHGVSLGDVRGGGGPGEEGPSFVLFLLVLPGVFLVALLAYVYAAKTRHPANRMVRRLQAGDVAGAIQIGESFPPDRREFSVRFNLVVAYHRAGRDDEARTILAEIEQEGWMGALGVSEEQYRAIVDQLRELVGPETPPTIG
jgi:hypothetical protein